MELPEIAANKLRSARRIVIKLGTSLVTADDGSAASERLSSLVDSIVSLHSEERQIVLVSSGAIGLGRARLGLSKYVWAIWCCDRPVRLLGRAC